jgi:hypothetical protein
MIFGRKKLVKEGMKQSEVTCTRHGDKYMVKGIKDGRTVFSKVVTYYETESTKERAKEAIKGDRYRA